MIAEAMTSDCVLPDDATDAISMERAVMGAFVIGAEEAVSMWRAQTVSVLDATRALFTDKRHQNLADLVVSMVEAGKHVDFLTLFDEIRRRDILDAVGGKVWVAGHEQHFWCMHNARHHIDRLVDRWRENQAAKIGMDLVEQVRDGGDLNELTAAAALKLQALAKTDIGYETPNSYDAVEAAERMLRKEDEKGAEVIRWYMPELQQATGGLLRQKITFLYGCPGDGKTALAMMQAAHCIRAFKLVVCAFLMESDEDEQSRRYVMQFHGVDGRNLTASNASRRDVEGIRAGVMEYASMNNKLFLFRCGNVNAIQIEAAMKQWKQQTGLTCDLLIIDHLNTMLSGVPKVSSTTHEAITDNVLRCQNIAHAENAACLMLGQPPMEYYRGKQYLPRPTKGDIKGSATPVEKGKLILFLWYHPADRQSSDIVRGEIVIAKNNNGQEGGIRTLYLQPSALHVADTPQNHADYNELIQRYGGLPPRKEY